MRSAHAFRRAHRGPPVDSNAWDCWNPTLRRARGCSTRCGEAFLRRERRPPSSGFTPHSDGPEPRQGSSRLLVGAAAKWSLTTMNAVTASSRSRDLPDQLGRQPKDVALVLAEVLDDAEKGLSKGECWSLMKRQHPPEVQPRVTGVMAVMISVFGRLSARRHLHEPRRGASGSTRSLCALITASMSLYAIGTSSRPADNSVTCCSRRNRWVSSQLKSALAFVRLMRRPAPCAAELSDSASALPGSRR